MNSSLSKHTSLLGSNGDVVPWAMKKSSLGTWIWVLFSCKKNCKIDNVTLSFVFDKYYLIMD